MDRRTFELGLRALALCLVGTGLGALAIAWANEVGR
jgi:hypothetical protein